MGSFRDSVIQSKECMSHVLHEMISVRKYWYLQFHLIVYIIYIDESLDCRWANGY